MLLLAACVTAERPSGTDTGCDAPASWFADGDGDGLGDARFETSACAQPANYVENADDCDDGDAAVGGPALWHEDKDEDGYGWQDEDAALRSCTPIEGWLEDGTDCNDVFDDVHPGAPETCNMRDDDCDEIGDEDAIDAGTLYVDDDGDGYGVEEGAETGCYLQAQEGWVWDAGDCDDTDPEVHPGAEEHCDGLDENCDEVIDDDGVDPLTWYLDLDGDGFGRAAPSIAACEVPEGYAGTDDDCDDDDAAVHPEAPEHCDDVDEDCDGAPDDGALDAATWYADTDGDGFGDAAVTATGCAAPSGFLADATDCDDASAAIHPGADETCGGGDEDCDGTTDEDDAIDAGAWYADGDGDGFGGGTATRACTAPAGSFADGDDCDDADDEVSPGAEEVCSDGVDDDCDGLADDGCRLAGELDFDDAWVSFDGSAASQALGWSAAGGDLTGDGENDLVIGDGSAAAGLYLVAGPLGATSLLGAGVSFGGPAADEVVAWEIQVDDVDGDGVSDLVDRTWGDESRSYVLRGPLASGGSYSADTIVGDDPVGYSPLGEVDGSPGLELAFTHYGIDEVHILDADSAGYLGAADAVATLDFAAEGISQLALGDVTGDGRDELVAESGDVWIFDAPLDAASYLDYDVHYSGPATSNVLVVGEDFDEDGIGDLVALNYTEGVARLLNGCPTTSCSSPVTMDIDDAAFAVVRSGTGAEPLSYRAAAEDLDGDGSSDLAMSREGSAVLFYGPLLGELDSDSDADATLSVDGDEVSLGTVGNGRLFLGAPEDDTSATDAGWAGLF